MSKDNPKIGYKRPPLQSRFAKGASGNPSGRPRKLEESSVEILDRLSSEKVYVTIDGVKKKMSKEELIYTQLLAGAMKMQPTALRIYAQIRNELDGQKKLREYFPGLGKRGRKSRS